MKTQVLLCGVGGQGILFATRILSEAALSLGHAVIGSETHGMSQRGGSVTSHLKIGAFRGPLIRRGAADLMFCFEKGEIFANLSFLKEGGVGYIDALGLDFIPENVRALLQKRAIELRCFDASKWALELKAPQILNLILIGYACRHDDFHMGTETLLTAIEKSTPKRFLKVNLNGFEIGLRN